MQTKNKVALPQFQGKPLIEIPASIPWADFLRGDFGKAVYEEYRARISEEYQGNSYLNFLKYGDDMVKGSNPFAVSLINEIISEHGLHTATQADLERILKVNAFDLRGTYEDTALVLRSEDAPNEYLARDLVKQLQERKLLEYPVMILLKDLAVRNDADSPYRLAFTLKEDAEVIHAPLLNKNSGYFSSDHIDEKSGLPQKLQKEGERYFYTRDSGLSMVYLDDDLSVNSDGESLGGSRERGRVVVVSNAVGAQKISDDVFTAINEEYQTQLAEINERKERAVKEALSILQGRK